MNKTNIIKLLIANILLLSVGSMFPSLTMGVTLEGTWVPAVKEQVSFNLEKSILTERERSTLDVIDFVINFDNGMATFYRPEYTVNKDGQEHAVGESHIQWLYEPLYQGKDLVVLMLKHANSDDEVVQSYHFLNENLYWTYVYGADANGVQHIRQFFKRIKR